MNTAKLFSRLTSKSAISSVEETTKVLEEASIDRDAAFDRFDEEPNEENSNRFTLADAALGRARARHSAALERQAKTDAEAQAKAEAEVRAEYDALRGLGAYADSEAVRLQPLAKEAKKAIEKLFAAARESAAEIAKRAERRRQLALKYDPPPSHYTPVDPYASALAVTQDLVQKAAKTSPIVSDRELLERAFCRI